jgi:hypothetical protein
MIPASSKSVPGAKRPGRSFAMTIEGGQELQTIRRIGNGGPKRRQAMKLITIAAAPKARSALSASVPWAGVCRGGDRTTFSLNIGSQPTALSASIWVAWP